MNLLLSQIHESLHHLRARLVGTGGNWHILLAQVAVDEFADGLHDDVGRRLQKTERSCSWVGKVGLLWKFPKVATAEFKNAFMRWPCRDDSASKLIMRP